MKAGTCAFGVELTDKRKPKESVTTTYAIVVS